MKISSIDRLPSRNASHRFLVGMAALFMFALNPQAVYAVELPGVGPVDYRYQAEGEGLVIDVGLQYIKGKQLKKDIGIDIYVVSNKNLSTPGIQKPKVYSGPVPEPAPDKFATFRVPPSKLHSVNITHGATYWVVVDAFGVSDKLSTRRFSDQSFTYLDTEVLRKQRDDELEKQRQAQLRAEQLKEAQRQERQRQEQLRQEQLRQEQQRQEQARLEAQRQEQLRQEKQRQEQLRLDAQRKEQLNKDQQRQAPSKPDVGSVEKMPIVIRDTPASSDSGDDLDLSSLLGEVMPPSGGQGGGALPGPQNDAGLVAYYPFDQGTDDASGNGNHGAINGNVTLVPAKYGNGAKLNGVNSQGGTRNPDFIKVRNSPSLQFTNELTIAYWVRIDGDRAQTGANCSGDALPGKSGTVIAKNGDRFGWYTSDQAESSGFGINPYAGGQGASMNPIPSAFRSFRHVAYAISGNTINAYANGKLISTAKGNVNFVSANSQDLFIGVQNNTGGACLPYWFPLDGVIDDLRLYKRALGESEILNLYRLGNTLTDSNNNRVKQPADPDRWGVTVGVSNPQLRLNDWVDVNLFGSLPSTPVDIYLFVRKADTGVEYFYFNHTLNEPGQVQPWRRNVSGPALPETNPYFGFNVTQVGKSVVGVKILPAGAPFDMGQRGLHEQSFVVTP